MLGYGMQTDLTDMEIIPITKLIIPMAFKTFIVQVVGKGCTSDRVTIEATNIPQARQFAESRYPGCKIGGIRQA